ncbi:helix-turn-helix transcriptional regulator [Aquamicrobium sp. LC103]|uniref:helix-turn-helix domain-containing protein n=1 Tax=Aquamicrobium sp. LC103 TaxID=1120658 RepID=UPI00069A3460|nr:helix-turn-helix transcriptional regulator [Aquamicrobium sp. LC103]TKT77431.1 transcriptional regulator [Aquamicrobium sp. LC103]
MSNSLITPAQCRAARALIEWSRERLAGASQVALRTIVDFERGARSPRVVTMLALRAALEKQNVVFLANGEAVNGGPGVRLHVRQPQEGLRPEDLNAANDD